MEIAEIPPPTKLNEEAILEESYSEAVTVGIDNINNFVNHAIEAKGVKKEDVQNMVRLADVTTSTISHGIGHNIGFTHLDQGVMLNQTAHWSFNSLKKSLADKDWTLSFDKNPITKTNVQNLVNRIDRMSLENASYWQNEIDKDPSLDVTKDNGITAFPNK